MGRTSTAGAAIPLPFALGLGHLFQLGARALAAMRLPLLRPRVLGALA